MKKQTYEPPKALVNQVARQYGVNTACAWGLLVQHGGDVVALWHEAKSWPFSVVCLTACGNVARVANVSGDLYVVVKHTTGTVWAYFTASDQNAAVKFVEQNKVAMLCKYTASETYVNPRV